MIDIESHLAALFTAYHLGSENPHAANFKNIVDWCIREVDDEADEVFQAMISGDVGIDWSDDSNCPLLLRVQFH